MTGALLNLASAKEKAKRLRADLATCGTPIRHAQALERVAHQHGFRDWNTLYAMIGNRPPEGWYLGDRVTGSYLSQPFEASIVSVVMVRPGWFRLSLDLYEAVDVVTFESFSNFRKHIRAVVGPEGASLERTSDEKPHLVLDIQGRDAEFSRARRSGVRKMACG